MKTPPVLRGHRVVLRPLVEADIPPLTEMVRHPEVAQWWIDYDEERLRAETLRDPDVTPFAIELEGELIGLIEYTEENDPGYRFAMVDLTVDAAHVGQGLGTDALRTVIRYLMDTRGHHHIMIDPAAANARAIAAYEKVGFKPVGVMRQYELGPDGVWRDGLLMDLVAGELR
jgi:aminoglycoside 6'-N-acetyltransferase